MKTAIFAYRPHGEFRDCVAVAYTAEGEEVGFWVSSSLGFAKTDLPRALSEDQEIVEWLVGPAAWNEAVRDGRLRAGKIE